MNAQSDLAGDRKRRAEMTRPRFGGATNWMSTVQNVFDMETKFAEAIPTIPGIKLDSTLTSAIEKLTVPNEVSHCPACQ